MSLYFALNEIAGIVQSGIPVDERVERVLERVANFAGACKGFILVSEKGQFVQKHQIHYDESTLSDGQREFSRRLVQEAIAFGKVILTLDCSDHPLGDESQSLADLGHASVLVLPLRWNDRPFAVIYLERAADDGPFSEEARLFMNELTSLVAPVIYQAFRQDTPSAAKIPAGFESVICRHPDMLNLLETANLVARSDATTLIRGETGTGKEVIAQALFRNSTRARKPFITLHCGALPETLFESELFGHTRGAFTGANRDREGRIAQADGGTLFIDEVAEIPPTAQAKLLRFFQFNEFQRIGSDKVERVDVRIIAATHRNLEQMVAEGSFRQDLYYRLNVVELEIPPLRKRRTDIPLLIEFFLKQFWKQSQPATLESDARMALEHYHYPGNVRELAHVIERVSVLAHDGIIRLGSLPRPIQEAFADDSEGSFSDATSFVDYSNEELKKARERITKEAVEQVEKSFLDGLLKQCHGNITMAAKKAGMHRTYLYKLLSRYRDPDSES